jgi:glucokinase
MKHILAIEFGGQSIKAAVVDSVGKLTSHNKMDLSQARPLTYEKFGGDFEVLVRATRGKIELSAVGVAHPNPCDPETLTFMLTQKPAYKFLNGRPLDHLVHKSTGLSEFHTIYDAGAAGLGELWQGKIAEQGRFLLLTLGTGLGAVFIEDGFIVTGQHVPGIPTTGELWDFQYMNTNLENVTGTTKAAVAIYRGLGGSDPDVLAGDLKKLASMGRADQDSGIARNTFEEFGRRLGDCLGSTVRLFRPRAIILSGNIAQAFDLFAQAAEQALNASLGGPELNTSLAQSVLIDKGGLLGAAFRALNPDRPFRMG